MFGATWLGRGRYNTAMARLRTILTDDHPTLRAIAGGVSPAELADPEFQELIDEMFATMYDATGIGLAAPQVGVSKRFFVVDLKDGIHGPLVVVNPAFTLTEGEIDSIEGCLSIPGFIGDVKRFARVICTGTDRFGAPIEVEGTELFGRCLQHETDHLDGIMYTDKASNVRPVEGPNARAEADAAAAEAKAVEGIDREIALSR